MPDNMPESPWKPTRARQDFSEKLYFNVTRTSALIDHMPGWAGGPPGTFFYSVAVNTTAGYFELPNIMNNQSVGPLLVDDPNDICGADCEIEGIGFTPDI